MNPVSTVLKEIIRRSGLNRKGMIFTNDHEIIAFAYGGALIAKSKKRIKEIVKKIEVKAREVRPKLK